MLHFFLMIKAYDYYTFYLHGKYNKNKLSFWCNFLNLLQIFNKKYSNIFDSINEANIFDIFGFSNTSVFPES